MAVSECLLFELLLGVDPPLTQFSIIAAGTLEKCRPLGDRQLQRVCK